MTSHSIMGATKTAYLKLLVAQAGFDETSTPHVTVSLRAEAVAAAEQVLGVPLPPAVLLLFSEPNVFDMYNLELDQLASLREEAEDAGVPKVLLPLGRSGDRSGSHWVCIRKDSPGNELVIYGDADESRTTLSVAAWLDEVVETHLHGTELSDEEQVAVKAWAKKATLEIRLEVGSQAPKATYRVVHPKFGEGTVVREDGTGDDRKLEIDFGAGGVKILVARFVKRVAG